jgi:hypothetical protein
MDLQMKKTCQTKKNYQYHSVGNTIDEYVISPTKKIVFNSIIDLFHIIDGSRPLVIYILSLKFSIILFKLSRTLRKTWSVSDLIYND